MSTIVHERPGVYSDYDASTVVSGGTGSRVVGVAAKAARGTAGTAVPVTGYSAGVAAFGEDVTPGMSALLKFLFLNGVTQAVAVRVNDAGALSDYQAAFDALAVRDDVQIVVCDSPELTVQQALRDSVLTASGNRRERIAFAGLDGSVSELTARAAALNSERVILVGPGALDSAGASVSAVFAAAAAAGAAAALSDPAIPVNGAPLSGLGGVASVYSDNDIDVLVRGGVTPLECTAGVVSPVRGITTRTTTGGASNDTWRELTTIMIVDDVIPAVRSALRSRFLRSKNTAQNRSAIRSQVIVELEKKVAAQIIDSYGDVTAQADADDPTVCNVAFSFAVAHGLNRIYLSAHITV